MAVSRSTDPWESGTDPVPDIGFRMVFGLYAGSIGIVLLSVSSILLGIRTPDPLALLGFGIFAVGTLAGGIGIGRWRYGPERAGRSWLRHGFLLPGLVVVIPQMALLVAEGESGLFPDLLLAGFVTLLFGGTVAMMAGTRYATALSSSSDAICSWSAETSWRAKVRGLLMVLLVFGAVILLDIVSLVSVLPAVAGVVTGILVSSETSAHAYEQGLEIEQPFNRSFYAWDRFDGYELTDGELRLERSRWVDFRWRRDGIDDIETVVETLDERLGQ